MYHPLFQFSGMPGSLTLTLKSPITCSISRKTSKMSLTSKSTFPRWPHDLYLKVNDLCLKMGWPHVLCLKVSWPHDLCLKMSWSHDF